MSRPRIIQPGQSYTFSKYFELPFSPEDILAELGRGYEREQLQLPKVESVLNRTGASQFCKKRDAPYATTHNSENLSAIEFEQMPLS